jgi:DNA-binding NarL/FixJ family response regulator
VGLAGLFFAEAITPLEQTHRGAREANTHLNHIVKELSQRTLELAHSVEELKQEVLQRKVVEESLRASELTSSQLLDQSRQMQMELRQLSRQLLSAQEEERRRISRELHDVIGQTLTGINVLAMPLLNGLEATRQILHATPAIRVLILSAHADDVYVEQAMALGAVGYLIKQTAAHVLAVAIREVAKGRSVFSPAISKRRTHHERKAKATGELPKKNADRLTSREMEVLQLIAEGKANKETTSELHISIKTVEKHRQKVMEKLNIHDTASLTRHAISAGIIESSVQVTIL